MLRCPINTETINQVRSTWGAVYEYFRNHAQNNRLSDAQEAYTLAWDIISEALQPDFFELLWNRVNLEWVPIEEAHDAFSRIWLSHLMTFFTSERKKWRYFPSHKGCKLFPNDIESIIILWWQHACFIIWFMVRHAIQNSRKSLDSSDFGDNIDETRRFVMMLARSHLYIETSVVAKMEKILSEWRISTEAIYDWINDLVWFELPALWCPAIFFGDKRVGKSLFECMRKRMEEQYMIPSWWNCPVRKIRLLFSKLMNRLK